VDGIEWAHSGRRDGLGTRQDIFIQRYQQDALEYPVGLSEGVLAAADAPQLDTQETARDTLIELGEVALHQRFAMVSSRSAFGIVAPYFSASFR
jgi:hypothetical protein